MIFKLTDITKFICDYSDEWYHRVCERTVDVQRHAVPVWIGYESTTANHIYDDVLEFSYVPSNMSFRMKLFQMEVLNPKYDKSNADFVNDIGKERLAILTT